VTAPKPPHLRAVRVTVTVRPDQREKVARLQQERRLSAVIQAAIDAA